MIIERVTMTGADDSVNPKDLADISAEFPFVEWGILISKKQEGSFRFPSRKWIDSFIGVCTDTFQMNVSTHVCGTWAKEILLGECDLPSLPSSLVFGERVQINTHAQKHNIRFSMIGNLNTLLSKEFIFQCDNVNNQLVYTARSLGFKTSALFDTSGGAGIVPDSWPIPIEGVKSGYAGGIGPDNVLSQIDRISKSCPFDYKTWIDMERKVRSEDDSIFDLDKVISVLSQVKPLIKKEIENAN